MNIPPIIRAFLFEVIVFNAFLATYWFLCRRVKEWKKHRPYFTTVEEYLKENKKGKK